MPYTKISLAEEQFQFYMDLKLRESGRSLTQQISMWLTTMGLKSLPKNWQIVVTYEWESLMKLRLTATVQQNDTGSPDDYFAP
jgi:hypothetical protein